MTIIDDIAQAQGLTKTTDIRGIYYQEGFNEILQAITTKINKEPVNDRYGLCFHYETVQNLPPKEKYNHLMALLADYINVRTGLPITQNSVMKWVPPIVLQDVNGKDYPNYDMLPPPTYTPRVDIIINLPNFEVYLPFGLEAIPLCKDSYNLLVEAFNYYQSVTDCKMYKLLDREHRNEMTTAERRSEIETIICNEMCFTRIYSPSTVFIPTAFIENYQDILGYQKRIIRKYLNTHHIEYRSEKMCISQDKYTRNWTPL